MRNLIFLIAEFVLIIGLVIGIYYANFSGKFGLPYKYNKPIMASRLDLSNPELKEELIFFLTKELGLYGGEFKILDAVFLYTNKITGIDYILLTFEAPDGKLCQVTVSRNILPYAKWELNPESLAVLEPPRPLLGPEVKTPPWLEALGVTEEQLDKYYLAHPDIALKPESAFFDVKTGKYNLPADWYQTVFALEIEKGKTIRFVPDTGKKNKTTMANTYWKLDYPAAYLGPGYRAYLYEKIKDRK